MNRVSPRNVQIYPLMLPWLFFFVRILYGIGHTLGNNFSESYVARILPLATLSPRIQEAIVTGTQPLELTLENLVRTRLPLDWASQENRFAITAWKPSLFVVRNTLFLWKNSLFSLRISLSSKNYEDSGSIVAAFIPYKIDRLILSFDDSALVLSKALPHIKNAIDLSVLNRIWITTQNIPLCTLNGYEHHVAELYSSPEGNFKKAETCKECHFDEFCSGLKSSYADTFGFNDLIPSRENNHMIEDIKNLANETL